MYIVHIYRIYTTWDLFSSFFIPIMIGVFFSFRFCSFLYVYKLFFCSFQRAFSIYRYGFYLLPSRISFKFFIFPNGLLSHKDLQLSRFPVHFIMSMEPSNALAERECECVCMMSVCLLALCWVFLLFFLVIHLIKIIGVMYVCMRIGS